MLYIRKKLQKISLHADDTTLFLKDEQDMYYALEMFNAFSQFRGLHINE